MPFHCNYFFKNQEIKTFWTASLSCSRLLCRSRRCLCLVQALSQQIYFIFIIIWYYQNWMDYSPMVRPASERETFKRKNRNPDDRAERERCLFIKLQSESEFFKKIQNIRTLKFLSPSWESKFKIKVRERISRVWSYKWSPE